ncbi:hypothetical protein Tco_0909753 [Tanacetum coccineum]|uniref:Uncharacterized protein n=1 Tax=Tanacetum coccineum TaxID=301880 RepID=A0ABQ5CT39_9ASTR
MDIRMSRLEKMISEKNVTTPATVKAVEEVCVTCVVNWKDLRLLFLVLLHPLILLSKGKTNPRKTSMDKVQKPSSENTAQVPPPEEEDSIFIEIPKPKAKKTVNVEIQDLNSPRPNSYQSKLPYPERMKVRENDKPSAKHIAGAWRCLQNNSVVEIGLKDALTNCQKFKSNG